MAGRMVRAGTNGWIVQVNCVQDSHIETLWFPDIHDTRKAIAEMRDVGVLITEDDGSITSWPPHLLGCFQIYQGEVEIGMSAPMRIEEAKSMD
jgi:hypothetical protein